jgi:hypothetical protein
MRRLLAPLAALLLAAGPAAACLVCIDLPERTTADRLVEAEVVALAREDPDRPFTYAPVALLRGADPPPIPLLVDSATRRRLAAAPSDAVVMAYEAEDGWTQLAYADPPMRQTVEAILAAAPGWAREGPAARFAFFAERHDHPDPAIRQLALAEISAAPYALIRTIRPRLPRAEIAAVLRDPARMAWAPVHILFLGLSDDPADHALVRRAVETAARHGIATHLGAWATAYAEIDGPQAVERLRALHFADPSRPEALRAVVTAFSTLARGGDPALRPGIDAAFRALAAEGPPALAGEAARQLTWAQDWSQAGAFAERLASGSLDDPAAEFVVALYLEAAREALGPADTPADTPADWSLE